MKGAFISFGFLVFFFIGCNGQKEPDELILGYWINYKDVYHDRVNNNSEEQGLNLTFFENGMATQSIDLGNKFNYDIVEDTILTLGSANYIIKKLTENEMILADPPDVHPFLSKKRYYKKGED